MAMIAAEKTWAIGRIFLVMIPALVILVSCHDSSQPVPPLENFTVPALGTLVPPSEVESPNVTSDYTGMMFVNSSTAAVSVVVSDTIATIPAGFGFLMQLIPGTYRIYIYEQNSSPKVNMVEVTETKMRYVYLISWGAP